MERKLLKAMLVAMSGVVGMGVPGCDRNAASPPSPSTSAPTPGSKDPTRQELVKRLQQLAKNEPPKDLSHGALCYAPLEFEKKACPDCKRLAIVGVKDVILNSYNVPLKHIQDHGIQATLIVPEHCAGCGEGLNAKKFQLEIKYSDQPEPVRVELTGGAYDLEIMALFLQGKDRHKDRQDFEKPLQSEVERLRELFGVKE